MRRLLILLSLIALGFGWAIPAARGAGSYDFTTFDVPFTAPFPGAVNTLGIGINIFGQVVGVYVNAPFTTALGFLRGPDGTFVKIEVPANLSGGPSTFQWPRGINNNGVIVGRYRSAGFFNPTGDHCFVLSAGAFTTVDVSLPGAFGTRCTGINDFNQIVGTYFTRDVLGVHRHGFLFSGGVFSTIDFPGATNTFANKINDSGQIVGEYLDAGGRFHGFLLDGGSISTFDFPGAIETEADGINNNGQIVGDYVDTDNHVHGFLFANGTFTSVALPGVIQNTNGSTLFDTNFNVGIAGINDAGVITGVFLAVDGNFHGFVGVPQNSQ